MKEETHYICEICGQTYSIKEEAEKCEQKHVSPKEIRHWDYSRGERLPRRIEVVMDDGTCCSYGLWEVIPS